MSFPLRPSTGSAASQRTAPSKAGADATAEPLAQNADLTDPRLQAISAFPIESVLQRGLAQLSLRTAPLYRIATLAATSGGLWLLWTSLLRETPSLWMIGFGGAFSIAAVWHLVWVLSWRLSYDSIGLSAPNRWFGREARMWRQMTGISSDGPFITQIHFADGLVMRLPNLIQGRRELMATAYSWLEQGHAPDRH